jgi:citrate lyase beta subunit
LTLQPNTEWLVRINPVGSGFETDDLNAVLYGKGISTSTDSKAVPPRRLPDGIVLPKVESAEHVKWLDHSVPRTLHTPNGQSLPFILLIESAKAVLNLKEIVTAVPNRTVALIFGADDYTADIGAVYVPFHSIRVVCVYLIRACRSDI